jgi:multiple sugar transport system substrate-binding protein
MTPPNTSRRFSRRHAIALGTGGAALAAIRLRGGQSEDRPVDTVSVLAPLLPDPAPPGVLDYQLPSLRLWEAEHQAVVKYESAAVENMKAKILINFRRGYHMHDVMYCAGWAPELAANLAPVDSLIGPTLREDLPPWALRSFRWKGKTYGVPSSANPMILFANGNALARAGIDGLPLDWDALVETARLATHDGRYGWTMPTGQTGGLGGLMSHWLIFFLQAGGEVLDEDGLPTITTDAGVAAIEMLQRLKPYTDAKATTYKSIIDASASFLRGDAAMMMNWAVSYRTLSDPELNTDAASLWTGVLPAGPVGTASIDSGDGWTVDVRTWVAPKAVALIQFYLDPRVQRQMYAQTGWLPISRSTLEDEEFQQRTPHAAAVSQQLRSRIDSSFTPNYDVITRIIGVEVGRALAGEATPLAALRNARDQLIAVTRPFSR